MGKRRSILQVEQALQARIDGLELTIKVKLEDVAEMKGRLEGLREALSIAQQPPEEGAGEGKKAHPPAKLMTA